MARKRTLLLFVYHAIRNGSVMWRNNENGVPAAHYVHSMGPLKHAFFTLYRYDVFFQLTHAHDVIYGAAPRRDCRLLHDNIPPSLHALLCEAGDPNVARPDIAEALSSYLERLIWPKGRPLRKQHE